MLCLFILLFIVVDIIFQKIIKYAIENNIFSILMGFLNANENVFHGFGTLAIWLWISFGNILRAVCTGLGLESVAKAMCHWGLPLTIYLNSELIW